MHEMSTVSVTPTESFALCRVAGATDKVYKIPVARDVQEKIENLIEGDRPRFMDGNMNEVPIDPTFKCDSEHIMCIRNFDVPEHILDAMDKNDEVEVFPVGDSHVKKIKAIFHIDPNGNIYFQCWRNFEFLSRKKILSLYSRQTFQLNNEHPFILDTRLDAVYSDGNLLFFSFANVQSMLDLFEYVRDATEDDIEKFKEINALDCGDLEIERLSLLNRKRIKLIVDKGVLATMHIDDICDRANDVDFELPIRNGKIHVPRPGKTFNELLSFLDEKIYRGPLSGKSMLSTSSRPRGE